MTILTHSDLRRVTVSALGALLVSTACVGAAVWPAKAADVTISTASAWQAEVERRIDNAMTTPLMGHRDAAMAEVVMRFDERGNFRSATLGKTSGIGDVDQEALRVANAISYPALPAHLQGKPQRVAMQLFFGNDGSKVSRQRLKAAETATALAAKADANRAEARIATQPAG
jgi:hypothetical protein